MCPARSAWGRRHRVPGPERVQQAIHLSAPPVCPLGEPHFCDHAQTLPSLRHAGISARQHRPKSLCKNPHRPSFSRLFPGKSTPRKPVLGKWRWQAGENPLDSLQLRIWRSRDGNSGADHSVSRRPVWAARDDCCRSQAGGFPGRAGSCPQFRRPDACRSGRQTGPFAAAANARAGHAFDPDGPAGHQWPGISHPAASRFGPAHRRQSFGADRPASHPPAIRLDTGDTGGHHDTASDIRDASDSNRRANAVTR